MTVGEFVAGTFALVLVIEGLLPFANPGLWRRMFERALQLTDRQIRLFGLGSLTVGVGLLLLFAP